MNQLERAVWAAVFARYTENDAGSIADTVARADEAVLLLRARTAFDGKLHEDDDLEAERRAELDLPEPQGEDHTWVSRMVGRHKSPPFCAKCGVVQNAEGRNKPCPGWPPKVGLREDERRQVEAKLLDVVRREQPWDEKSRALEVILACNQGEQACHQCPILSCCDNTTKEAAIIKERDEARANARILAHAYEHDSRPPPSVVAEAMSYPAVPGSEEGSTS